MTTANLFITSASSPGAFYSIGTIDSDGLNRFEDLPDASGSPNAAMLQQWAAILPDMTEIIHVSNTKKSPIEAALAEADLPDIGDAWLEV